MSRLNLLEKGRSYTFRSYFEMPYGIDQILLEFGVGFELRKLSFARAEVPASIVEAIQADIESNLEIVLLSSETARREILVAPVLTKAARLSKSQLRIEYFLQVDDQLKGKLDYLVIGKQRLLVIEAKNDDMTRGFTQLAVELIALSRQESAHEKLYGAVTIGEVWSFGMFDAEKRQFIQDTSRYRVPEDVNDVLGILVGILAPDQATAPG